MTKCPKGNKNCKPSVCFITSKKNFICSCISEPSKYPKDVVSLCLKGYCTETALEMTREEALGIISVLTASLVTLGFDK